MSEVKSTPGNFTKAYAGFNKIIDQFLDNLIKILPNNNDLKVFKSKLNQLRFAQPSAAKLLLKTFASKLVKYKEHILNKDEKFFTEDLKVDNNHLADAIKIKELWKTSLTENNKENVWKYFFIMTKMATKMNPSV